MDFKQKLAADLKSAMLARDSFVVETLRGLKSAVLYEEVAKNKRDQGLSEDEMMAVFKREAKKRSDAIALYVQGGNEASAQKERDELALIEGYLPEQLSEEQTLELVDSALKELAIEVPQKSDTGKIIGKVKQLAGNSADPATIAKIVNSKLA